MTTSNYVVVGGETYPVDSEEQIEAAKAALYEVGEESANVYVGQGADSYRNGQVLWAAAGDAEDYYAASPEHLGPLADALDVEAFDEAIDRAFAAKPPRTHLDAQRLVEKVLGGAAGNDDQGRDWVQIAAGRRGGATPQHHAE